MKCPNCGAKVFLGCESNPCQICEDEANNRDALLLISNIQDDVLTCPSCKIEKTRLEWTTIHSSVSSLQEEGVNSLKELNDKYYDNNILKYRDSKPSRISPVFFTV